MKVILCFFVVVSMLSLARPDMVDVASQQNDLGTLVGLIETANLTETVNTTQDITLFAPTNNSISSADPKLLGDIQSDPEKLREALLYHVHPAILPTTNFVNDDLISTLDPRNNTIRTNVYNNPNGTVYTANGARIVEANINASNGLIQIIDKFLVPPNNTIDGSIASNSSFSILDRLIVAAGLTDELNGTITLFAPTDAAFLAVFSQQTIDNLATNQANSTLLRKILLYHVVPTTFFTPGFFDGQTLTTLAEPNPLNLNMTVTDSTFLINNNAKIIVADWIQTNGVIQVIDKVLLPPLTIFEIDELQNLTRLTSALTAVGLATQLDDPNAGPFTQFAPTNAAFESFNTSGTVNETLENILNYHLLSPNVLRTENFQNEELLPTLFTGNDVRTNIYNANNSTSSTGNETQPIFTVNCAVITIPNLVATNGIVHVINKVMVPPTTDALTYINQTADLSEFAALIASSNMTLNITNPVTVFAPNNAAIRALSAEDRATLLNNETLLNELILNHFVAGTQCSAGLVPSSPLTSLQGSNLTFGTSNQGAVLINNRATIVDPDIVQTDGVVQVIDTLLSPPIPGIPQPPTGVVSTTGAVSTGEVSTAGVSSAGERLIAFFGLVGLLCLALL